MEDLNANQFASQPNTPAAQAPMATPVPQLQMPGAMQPIPQGQMQTSSPQAAPNLNSTPSPGGSANYPYGAGYNPGLLGTGSIYGSNS